MYRRLFTHFDVPSQETVLLIAIRLAATACVRQRGPALADWSHFEQTVFGVSTSAISRAPQIHRWHRPPQSQRSMFWRMSSIARPRFRLSDSSWVGVCSFKRFPCCAAIQCLSRFACPCIRNTCSVVNNLNPSRISAKTTRPSRYLFALKGVFRRQIRSLSSGLVFGSGALAAATANAVCSCSLAVRPR